MVIQVAEILTPGAKPHLPSRPLQPRPLGLSPLQPEGAPGHQSQLPDPQQSRAPGLATRGRGQEETQPHVCCQVQSRDECRMHFQFLIMFKSLFC